MPVTIREVTPDDRADWLQMRRTLWPDEGEEAHLDQTGQLLKDPAQSAYLAMMDDDRPVGFAEVSLRAYANGCHHQPVPFLEGIWVSPGHRNRGIGRLLMDRIAEDLRARGYREICSDADQENKAAHRAHEGWGFQETERVVYFRRDLG